MKNILSFSFGRNVPGKTDPMDGVEGIAEKVGILTFFSSPKQG